MRNRIKTEIALNQKNICIKFKCKMLKGPVIKKIRVKLTLKRNRKVVGGG